MKIDVNVAKALNSNFWLDYPEILQVSELKTLYDEDKSKTHLESSKILWAFALHSHLDSPLYNLPDKVFRIPKTLNIKKEDPFSKKYAIHLAAFEDVILDEAEMAMHVWKKKMRERRIFMDSLAYDPNDLDAAVAIDKMMALFPKLMEDYSKIRKMLSSSTTKKNAKPQSGSDSGLI
jgi:hypothetical protein